MSHSVLLDTSFFIRLLNPDDKLHNNAKDYFKYFLENDIVIKISTISVAEYCVRGKIGELPLEKVQIIPFNIDHAVRAGELASIVFNKKSGSEDKFQDRKIISNDTKLFTQADLDPSVTYFLTSDSECRKVYDIMASETKVSFEIIDLNNPYHEVFGKLDLQFDQE